MHQRKPLQVLLNHYQLGWKMMFKFVKLQRFLDPFAEDHGLVMDNMRTIQMKTLTNFSSGACLPLGVIHGCLDCSNFQKVLYGADLETGSILL
ncbi:uncharacterized protein [Phaseolus vulgaris]|uniref:uncharacterized protein isoform X2 n=1 Tax=Phaseolus vulgaris TaxID=3885 RepID=UPI0035C9DE02